MKKSIVLLLMIITLFSFTACDKTTQHNTNKNKTVTKDQIVGSWEHSGYVYTFNKDMTCSYSYGESIMNCNYENNGKKVSILYDGNTVASEYEYTISGDKLTIKDSFGDNVVYIKK